MKLAGARVLIALTALQFAATISPAAPTDPKISIKAIDKAQYELTLHASSATGILTAQQQLLATAKEVCRDQPAHFGHYAFNLETPIEGAQSKSPPKLTFTQTIQCGSQGPSPVPQVANSPDGWKPSPNDQITVETQTYRYLNLKSAGEYSTAYAMFSESMKEATHLDSWQTATQSFNTRAGQLLNRRVRKITWYKDPPSAPLPGIYVAVDYSSEFADVPIHCGYVAWYRTPNGDYQIIHEEENSIAKASIAMMKPADVATLAAKFGCT
jgi:hypothetical protein